MNTLLKCPKCNTPVEITTLLKKEIEDNLLAELKSKQKEEIAKAKSDAENEFSQKFHKDIELFKMEIVEYQKKLRESETNEIILRKERVILENEKKSWELTMQRKIDEQKKEIEEKVYLEFSKEHKYKDLEYQKRITELTAALDEAKRKAQQGSMQTQGEVLELDIEETLKKNFPQDLIQPVEKGVEGADIRQIVRSPKGYHCGTILWESKKTKAWQDKWLEKLKNDLRNEKANIPAIITFAFPKEIKNNLGNKEGVFIVSYDLFIALAELLRKNLLETAYHKAVSVNRSKKSEQVYDYITSHEFIQQVEALAEVYQDMQEELVKERMAFEKIWKSRESQLKKLISSTASFYGSIQGLAGSNLPQIKKFDLPLLE